MRIVIIFILFIAPFFCFSKSYYIGNAAMLHHLKLKAGDTVVLKNGIWKNQDLHFKGEGTPKSSILLKAETDGKVYLEGNSNLKIDGTYLTVTGLQFTNGYSLKADVVIFTPTSKYCRLTKFYDYQL